MSHSPPAEVDALCPRSDYEPPHGDVEKAVIEIWREVLGAERVGRNDDFFELGGHSLSGIRVIWRIGEILKVTPPLVSIFGYPTVREMAALVESILAQNVPVSPTDPRHESDAI